MTDARFLQSGFDAQSAHVVEEIGELMERLGPVLAAIGKTKRWGLDSSNPDLPPASRVTNREWLRGVLDDVGCELDDVRQTIGRLIATMDAAPPLNPAKEG
jgi:hypothetical protein